MSRSQVPVRVALAIVAIVAAIVTSSCRGKQPRRPLDRVRIGNAPFLSYLPIMIANEEGYFRDEGIEVEFVRTSPEAASAILETGGIDVYAGQIAPSLLNAIARGVHVQIVADKGTLSPTGCAVDALIARSALFDRPGFGSPQSLRGLRSRWTAASVREFFMDHVLAPRGLTTNDLINTGITYTAMNAALAKQKIDIAILSEPYLTMALDTGHARRLVNVGSVLPHFPIGILIYGPRLLERDRPLGQRFMNAYLRGVEQYRMGKTDQNVEIAVRETHLKEPIVRKACWATIPADASVDPSSVRQFAEWAHAKGYADRLVRVSEIVDPSFAATARKADRSAPLHK